MVGLDLKGQNIHGMKDERWTTIRKVKQLKEAINLQKRDSEVTKYLKNTIKRREDRLLGELRKTAKQKQDDLRNALLGNQHKLWSTLCGHRQIQLAYGRNSPEAFTDVLIQLIDQKRKTKDRLLYKKRKLMNRYKQLVLKTSELEDLLILKKFGIKTTGEKLMQETCQARQVTVMRRIAATSVRETYVHILRILYKDSIYYNSVLDCLEADCRNQSQMLLAVTEMGQVVTEYVDDLSTEYDNLEKGIRSNMIEREKTLRKFTEVLHRMNNSVKQLVPTDVDDYNINKGAITDAAQDSVLGELKLMEKILNQVQQEALVSGYEHIYPRLLLQVKQHGRLTDMRQKTIILHETLLQNKLNLEVILNICSHTYNKDKIKYLNTKRDILRKIRSHQKKIEQIRTDRISKASDLLSIRKGFRHMWNVLKNVSIKGEHESETQLVTDEHGDLIVFFKMRRASLKAFPGRNPLTLVPEGEDSETMMNINIEKLKILYSAFKPNSKLARTAEVFFSKAMMETIDGGIEEAEIDLLAGLVIEDSRLPSYASIKMESAQFVKDNTVDELALVAAQVAARKKPGAFFRKLFKLEKQQRKANKCCSVY